MITSSPSRHPEDIKRKEAEVVERSSEASMKLVKPESGVYEAMNGEPVCLIIVDPIYDPSTTEVDWHTRVEEDLEFVESKTEVLEIFENLISLNIWDVDQRLEKAY